jgi:hypothetical protein
MVGIQSNKQKLRVGNRKQLRGKIEQIEEGPEEGSGKR